MTNAPLLAWTDRGLHCAIGGFYIDPIRSVDRAVITHAHADHARPGMRHYLAHAGTVALLRLRLGATISAQALAYGEELYMNGVRVSLHPAGHCVGSAQVRVEYAGEVWVASGDYKRGPDPYAASYEPVRCHTFITESTFALPIYRWPDDDVLVSDIIRWANVHSACGITPVLRCYPLGKAQRLVGLLTPHLNVRVDASIQRTNDALGIVLPAPSQHHTTIVISSSNTPPVEGPHAVAFASGWTLTEPGRARSAGIGFPVSDHADWDGLVRSVDESCAERILVTHGFTDVFARYLRERGYDAEVLA